MASSPYLCGPVRVQIDQDPLGFVSRLEPALDLYTAPWEGPRVDLSLVLAPADSVSPAMVAPYLDAARMVVFRTAGGLAARCDSGATVRWESQTGQWQVGVPPPPADIWSTTDLENLVSLILTTAWRGLGWTPFHAGLVARGEAGPAAMLCAPSGGGKTTLTLALIRRGWHTLGDDKLLLRPQAGGGVEARALVHSFNLYPHTRRWFDEVGDLAALPNYSVWTDKRRVPIARLAPDAAIERACPTHALQVTQSEAHSRVVVTPLPAGELLSLLLRQTVIPRDPATARSIMATVAALAATVVGLRVEIGRDAYLDPTCLEPLEQALGVVT